MKFVSNGLAKYCSEACRINAWMPGASENLEGIACRKGLDYHSGTLCHVSVCMSYLPSCTELSPQCHYGCLNETALASVCPRG